MFPLKGPSSWRTHFLRLIPLVCWASSGLIADPISLGDLSIPAGATVSRTVNLEGGSDLLELRGDWSLVAGAAASNRLEAEVVGPGEITAYLPVFDNASESGADVNGLKGSLRLTSRGTAGAYTFSFVNRAPASAVRLDNVTVELSKILEEFADNGSLGSESPTFERTEETGEPSGRNTRFASYTFTPGFDGTYVISSQQTGYDGFIALYAGDRTGAPPPGAFLSANDDAPAGESFSRMEIDLVAGEVYTLVSTSFGANASGSYTNRIRFAAPIETLPDYGPWLRLVGQGNLGFEAGETISILAEAEGQPQPTLQWFRMLDGALVAIPGATGTHLEIPGASPGDAGDYYLRATSANGVVTEKIATVLIESSPVPTIASYAEFVAHFKIVGAPSDDDDGNGISNLLEYALGRDFDTPRPSPLRVFIRNDRLVGRFFRNPGYSDITYILEASGDLTLPGWEVLYDSSVARGPNADGEFHEVEDSQSIGDGARFFRLRVVLGGGASVTTYAEYAARRGWTGGMFNDDDRNGLPNLLEYALGRDGKSPMDPPLDLFIRDGNLVVRFYRDAKLGDIRYLIEATSDLGATDGWEVIYDSSVDSSPNADGAFHEVTESAMTGEQRFFRLRVVPLGKPAITTFEEYAAARGLIGGRFADDDNNGLINLLEYALGRDDDSPNDPPLSLLVRDGKLVARFHRDPNLTDIRYIVEATSDLSAPGGGWEVIYNSETDGSANADGDYHEVTEDLATGGQRFFRLRVEPLGDPGITTFAEYAAREGLTGDVFEDDDGDGMANLMEYALGRDADGPADPPLEILVRDGRLVGRFYRDPALIDIAYVLEGSADLGAPDGGWTILYDSEIETGPNADGDYHEVEDPGTGDESLRFLRLRIVYLPAT